MKIAGRVMALAALASFPPFAPMAHAQSDGLRADIRCLVATSALLATADERTKAIANLAAIYYLGRVDGRSITAQEMEDRMYAEATAMTAEDMQKELGACGETMRDAGARMTAMGLSLQRRSAP